MNIYRGTIFEGGDIFENENNSYMISMLIKIEKSSYSYNGDMFIRCNDGGFGAYFENNKEIMIYYLKRYQGAPSTDDNFTSVDDIKLGDELVICGQAFNYNGNTLEFGSGTYCITINDVVQGPRS